MDLLFGTYICPDREPDSFGLNEAAPKTYLGHIVQPLLPHSQGSVKIENEYEKMANESNEILAAN
jgi:hypothetical protein